MEEDTVHQQWENLELVMQASDLAKEATDAAASRNALFKFICTTKLLGFYVYYVESILLYFFRIVLYLKLRMFYNFMLVISLFLVFVCIFYMKSQFYFLLFKL